MRVLHAANFSTKKYGAVFYATDRKLSNGFIRNGHFVYEFSDRDIARQENIFGSKKLGQKKLNQCLLKTLKNLRPELLLLGHTDLIFEETLDEARRLLPDLRIAQWFVDPLFEPWTQAHLKQRIPHLDGFFCTSAGDALTPYRAINKNCFYLPNPVDPSIESLRNDEKDQFDIDLLYCGIDYKDPLRSQLLNGLNDNLQEVRFSLYGSLGNPPVFGADYLDVLAKSKMGLNLSRRDNIPYYSSDRIAQLSGNGLLVFIPETPGFRDLYTDEEVVYFQGRDDLEEKVHHYQGNDGERRQIARRGREKAHSSFNTTRVAQFITEATFSLEPSEDYEWADV
ncbi:MAG: glycosyltransferase [Candidatus Sedimenticola sp. (ex Thyasira tokunagai)]